MGLEWIGLEERKDANTYPWGGEFKPDLMYGNLLGQECDGKFSFKKGGPIQGYKDNFLTTGPVMSDSKDQRRGVYDLAGNVSEWCQDADEVDSKERIVRGGAWIAYKPVNCSSAVKSSRAIDQSYPFLGFRLVMGSK